MDAFAIHLLDAPIVETRPDKLHDLAMEYRAQALGATSYNSRATFNTLADQYLEAAEVAMGPGLLGPG